MATRIGSSGESAKGELVITRIFDAPRERVFKAWTDCDYLTRWCGSWRVNAPDMTILPDEWVADFAPNLVTIGQRGARLLDGGIMGWQQADLPLAKGRARG